MNITNLCLNNFYCYRTANIPFKSDGIYVVYGKNKQTQQRNGIGKTAIAEAITYALYGKTRHTDTDKVITFGQAEMAVKLTFTIEGHEYTIVRKRGKGKTNLSLTKNGEHYSGKTATDTQKIIEDVIKIDYEKFIHSFYFTPASDLKSLTTTKLINFLKTVLKLDRFDVYREKIQEKVREIDNKLSRLIGIRETLAAVGSKSIGDLEGVIQKHNKTLEEVQANYREESEELSGSEKRVSDLGSLEVQDKTKLGRLQKQLAFITKNKQCPLCKTELGSGELNQRLRNELVEIEKHLVKVVEKKRYEEKLTERHVERIDYWDEKEREIQKIITEAETELKLLMQKKEINPDEVEKTYKKLVEAKAIAEQVSKIFNPTGLPLFILQEYLPKLEIVVNEVLQEVSDFRIEIVTETTLKSSGRLKNTCELGVVRAGQVYDIENLSSGQETLVTLAFKIGVAKLFLANTNFSTLVIDEGFGKLGEVNQKRVVEMVEKLKQTFSKILIISHVDFIRDYFSQEHQIVIEQNGTVSSAKYIINTDGGEE